MNARRHQLFEPQIAKADVSERLRFFREYTFAHPIMREIRGRLNEVIADSSPGSLVFVIGPAGVGKTTLCTNIHNTLVRQTAGRLSASQLAAIMYSLKPPMPPAFFNWTDNLVGLLDSVGEPLASRKIHPDELTTHDLPSHIRNRSKSDVRAVRGAFEQVLKWRRPVAVLLDEAQVLTKSPAARLLDQLDVIKSLASRSGVPHILFGTYALLPVRDMDGQESRRSIDLHFRRYTSSKEDRSNFEVVVENLALAMPFGEPPDLDPYLDLLHEKSAGCVGVLKPWLERAYAMALRMGSKTIKEEHIVKNMHSKNQLVRMFTEIMDGEDSLQASEENYANTLNELINGRKKDSNEQVADIPRQDSVPPKRKPGMRRPNRDVIGTQISSDERRRKVAS